MAGTLCLSGAMFYKAGSTVNTTIKNETFAVAMINQAESFLNVISKKNWIDAYAGLNADVKLILEEACSNLAAIYAIQYDLSGTTMTSLQRIDSEDKINVLYRRFMDCVKILENQDYVKYITGA